MKNRRCFRKKIFRSGSLFSRFSSHLPWFLLSFHPLMHPLLPFPVISTWHCEFFVQWYPMLELLLTWYWLGSPKYAGIRCNPNRGHDPVLPSLRTITVPPRVLLTSLWLFTKLQCILVRATQCHNDAVMSPSKEDQKDTSSSSSFLFVSADGRRTAFVWVWVMTKAPWNIKFFSPDSIDTVLQPKTPTHLYNAQYMYPFVSRHHLRWIVTSEGFTCTSCYWVSLDSPLNASFSHQHELGPSSGKKGKIDVHVWWIWKGAREF